MRNIKLYDYQDDFSEAEGQGDYVMSIEPGVAYVRENTSVKYNKSEEYDLVVELDQRYIVDSSTSTFIEALYADNVSSFKILVTSEHNEIYDNNTGEYLSECVIDETWLRTTYGTSVYYGGSNYNIDFRIDNNSPKTYSAYVPTN